MSLRPKTFAEAVERKKKAAQRKRDRATGAKAARPVPSIGELLATGVVQTADALVAAPAPRTVGSGARKVGRPIEKSPRWVSSRWLAGIRRGRCVVCDRPADEPHHVVLKGMRADIFDLLCLPMCRQHHEAAHDGRIDRDEVYRLLGAYLCWRLPRVPPSVAKVVLKQFHDGMEG